MAATFGRILTDCGYVTCKIGFWLFVAFSVVPTVESAVANTIHSLPVSEAPILVRRAILVRLSGNSAELYLDLQNPNAVGDRLKDVIIPHLQADRTLADGQNAVTRNGSGPGLAIPGHSRLAMHAGHGPIVKLSIPAGSTFNQVKLIFARSAPIAVSVQEVQTWADHHSE